MNNINFSWPQHCKGESSVWVAAHSPISKFDISGTIRLFKKYEKIGVPLLTTGEIILDCLDNEMRGPVIRLCAHKDEAGDPMGFHLLGPAEPNLIPAKVGIDLCNAAVKECQVPIIANIGYLGATLSKKCEENLKKIIDTGISGFEVALSCPTLEHQGNEEKWWNDDFLLIELIRKLSSLPIGLKIGHRNFGGINFEALFKRCNSYKVTQLAMIDGIRLICPPKISADATAYFPFDDYPALCNVSAYGPWNRFLLYDDLARLNSARNKFSDNNVKISAIGGIMSTKHVFEAMALGADNVQLSSVVFWNGINKVRQIIREVQENLGHFNESMKNRIFEIDASPKAGLERMFGENYVDKWNACGRVSVTDVEKCTSCGLCCDIPCLARTMSKKTPELTEHLCSGCGWCREICPVDAIYMKSRS